MSGIASPPRAVWQYETSDSGRWLALFSIATFGRFGASKVYAHPSRETVAKRSGQKLDTLKRQIGKLRAAGSLVRHGRGWMLEVEAVDWPDYLRPPAAPPEEILSAEISAGRKRALIGLWSFADYDCDGPATVRPTIAEVATRTGQSARSVRDQIAWLCKHGYASRNEDALVLALTQPPASPLEANTQPPQYPHPAATVPAPSRHSPPIPCMTLQTLHPPISRATCSRRTSRYSALAPLRRLSRRPTSRGWVGRARRLKSEL